MKTKKRSVFLPYQPEPSVETEWYAMDGRVLVHCPQCDAPGKRHREKVRVLEYVPVLDHEPDCLEHRQWRAAGFLAWYICPNCGDERFEPVTTAVVLDWGKRAPWVFTCRH